MKTRKARQPGSDRQEMAEVCNDPTSRFQSIGRDNRHRYRYSVPLSVILNTAGR